MKNKKNGFSIISMLFWMAIVGVVGIYGFQIGMGYLDKQSIKGAVITSLSEAENNEDATAKDIKANIVKRLTVTTIDLPSDAITVSDADNGIGFHVKVDFTKTIKITNKMNLVMNLDVDESSIK
jgi:type II secretory pathway pseudopilin PulG